MEERMKKWKNSGVVGDIFAKFTESQDVSNTINLSIKITIFLTKSKNIVCKQIVSEKECIRFTF